MDTEQPRPQETRPGYKGRRFHINYRALKTGSTAQLAVVTRSTDGFAGRELRWIRSNPGRKKRVRATKADASTPTIEHLKQEVPLNSRS